MTHWQQCAPSLSLSRPYCCTIALAVPSSVPAVPRTVRSVLRYQCSINAPMVCATVDTACTQSAHRIHDTRIQYRAAKPPERVISLTYNATARPTRYCASRAGPYRYCYLRSGIPMAAYAMRRNASCSIQQARRLPRPALASKCARAAPSLAPRSRRRRGIIAQTTCVPKSNPYPRPCPGTPAKTIRAHGPDARAARARAHDDMRTSARCTCTGTRRGVALTSSPPSSSHPRPSALPPSSQQSYRP